MKVSDLNVREMLSFEPEEGRVLLKGDRMLIFRQEAMSVMRGLLYDQLGEEQATACLSAFGYRCGRLAYDNAVTLFGLESEQDCIEAAFVLQTAQGHVHAEPTLLEHDRAKGHLHIRAIWRNSYEAQSHIARFGISETPVCHSLAGHASGFVTEFMGIPMLALETKCAGQGDEHCEVEIRPVDAWGAAAEPWKALQDRGDFSLMRELEAKNAMIQEQELAISELNTPVMEIWDDVLVLPIVGIVDTRRSMEIMNNLLVSIEQSQARCVIIDVTGVEVVDTKTADYLLKVMRAANLLGSRCVLTGLSSAIAQTLVEIGADLSEVRTLRNIKEGLKDCLKFLRAQTQSE